MEEDEDIDIEESAGDDDLWEFEQSMVWSFPSPW